MASGLLDEIIASFDDNPDQEAIVKEILDYEESSGQRWFPNPGPQTDAFFSKADELFYGGAAGGGKTDLVLGLADTSHTKSLFLRRIGKNLRAIESRLTEIEGGTKGYNSQTGRWRLSTGGSLFLGHCQHENNKFDYQGQDHDLKAFDELPQFTLTQYLYIIAWNRSTKQGQRCRVIGAGNPPMNAEGEWVNEYWGPWLDPDHPNPAEPGELRWYTVIDGESVEREGPKDFHEVIINGETQLIAPKSRTFIPAFTTDNPYLGADYLAKLAATPEPMRSRLMLGSFNVKTPDPEDQVIPTEWVRDAQARWQKRSKDGLSMSALGIDVAMGGNDNEVFAPRYGGYFDELVVVKGAETPSPSNTVAEAVKILRDGARAGVDMGGGYGSGVFERLEELSIKADKFVPSAKSHRRDRTKTIEFVNYRAEAIWNLRDALDPQGGYDIALPPGREIVTDLCAYRFVVLDRNQANVIKVKIESKEDLKKRLGRSPDKGDAIVIAWNTGEVKTAMNRHNRANQSRDGDWVKPNVVKRKRSAKRHGV